MSDASIPVDLFNPGQVFACLGFLEAADTLLGDAEGSFDWSDAADVKFCLGASDERSPFEVVLEFLAEAEPEPWGPVGYADPSIELVETFPAEKGDQMVLPIRFGGSNRPTVELSHWVDGSSRESFKLYAGNRSALTIATAMLQGSREKPKKGQNRGDLKTKGIAQLWCDRQEILIEDPFGVLTPMGGSFNFDPRGAWTAINAGYSPNKHNHQIEASPVVEFLAAWGLENARPAVDKPKVRYAAWGIPLPPLLARAAFSGDLSMFPLKRFCFDLGVSGKNKVVNFAELETQP